MLRVGVVSHILPPSPSGQATVLRRLLEGFSADRCVLLSRERYDGTGGAADGGGKLPLPYFAFHPSLRLPSLGRFPGSSIRFAGDTLLEIRNRARQILHFPRGHTDGDVIVFFPKSNVVHMGDTFVTYGLPFEYVASGGSLLGMIEGVEKAMAAVPDDVKVIPGHGPVSSKADVLAFVAMLRDCVRLVDQAMQKGQSLQQMQEDGVLAKYDHLGKSFVKTASFVELIYNELRGAQPSR